MNKSKPIRPKSQYLIFGSPSIEEPEIQEVLSSLKSGWLGTGPKVEKFEREFAQYKGIKNAIAVNSGTAALHLSLLASGLKKGDEVITTALTFCATVNAIIHSGATPVLADVDPKTMNIDPRDVESKISPRTRAILPVHFAGRPCEMDELSSIVEKYNLILIEDCAHAIETEYKGKKAGTFGDFGCFSFYVTKNVVTGEGGMILAKKKKDASKIKTLALHGMSRDAWTRFSDEGYKHYKVIECGYKYNMMDLQAAIGIHQLRRVKNNWSRRKAIWEKYNEAFKDMPFRIPENPAPTTLHAYHLYNIILDRKTMNIERDKFLQTLHWHNIGSGVHYLSIPEHPFYKTMYGWCPEDYPNAMLIGRNTVSLPLSAKLTDGDVDDVICAVESIINSNNKKS